MGRRIILLAAIAVLPAFAIANPASASQRTALALALPVASAVAAPSFQSLSCGSATDCTAVGSYDIGGVERAMASSESSGRWSHATAIATPTTDGSQLSAVSCTGPGDCTAVGEYRTRDDFREPIAVLQVDGRWNAPVRLGLPESAAHPSFAILSSISCPRTGDCSAVGDFLTGKGTEMPLAETERDGIWTAPAVVFPPAKAASPSTPESAEFSSVSCVAPGSCTAVGDYSTPRGQEAMASTENRASWGTALEIAQPRDGAAAPSGTLSGISCTGVGVCTAVGSSLVAFNGYEPDEVTEVDGIWRSAVVIRVPPSGSSAVPDASFVSVSCEHYGECATVGSYVDGADESQPMIALETAGSWGPGYGGSAPAGATTAGANFDAVSCTAIRCLAIGNYVRPTQLAGIMAQVIPDTW